MALPDFLSQLDALAQEAEASLANVSDAEGVEALRVSFVGAKSGRLKDIQKQMGKVDSADKPAAGKRFNEVKQQVEAALTAAQERVSSDGATSAGPMEDVTLPGKKLKVGRPHPIIQTIQELTDIMGRLGFRVVEGPEVEDERHNFEALNIPPEHPARHEADNFYLATDTKDSAHLGGTLLRSQTSTVQIRVMEKEKPPIRIISLGRVYRPDAPDDTHYPMFHQMEGLMVDKNVTMSDLKTVLRLFATAYLGGDVHIRFRPSFFPFTEPSVEADYYWNGQWVEFGGAGMVDPNVFKAVGYDPDEVSGFAFGLGVERLCMRRHEIANIRDLFKNDVRFLTQF